MQNLKPPDSYDMNNLQHFLGSPLMGELALSGNDATIWGSVSAPKNHNADIIGLRPRVKEDSFSRWLAQRATIVFKCGLGRVKKPDPFSGRVVYYDRSVLKWTFWMTSILASLMPIASIVVLISVKSLPGRVAVIAAFNVLISICLTVFTDAKRTDCFAVTAA